jgi:hypothetical protein
LCQTGETIGKVTLAAHSRVLRAVVQKQHRRAVATHAAEDELRALK